MDAYNYKTVQALDRLKEIAEEADEMYGNVMHAERPGEVQEALDDTALLLVDLFSGALRLLDDLREQGAEIEEPARSEEAIDLLAANLVGLVERNERACKEAVSTCEMIVERIRSVA